ncbi:MAG: cephalosporin hydroxylase [Parcubacteria group bacterium Licking1014_17]|nr:MAG: cephalosporin hydroxylase [Parcubacteria group bacterium Licking1014_17]
MRRIIREKAFISSGNKEEIVNQFHELYYSAATLGKTYKDTHFLGIPVRKCPLDLWIYQELIYKLKPDLIIECGTFRGGGALFFASICDIIHHGEVITIDIEDIHRPAHPRIKYFLGSSVSLEMFDKVRNSVKNAQKVMVVLDSDHSKEHVLKELRLYSDIVTLGQYLIVEDTNVNGHPVFPDHGPGPMEALDEFLKENKNFIISDVGNKFFLTFNPRGYLLKVK